MNPEPNSNAAKGGETAHQVMAAAGVAIYSAKTNPAESDTPGASDPPSAGDAFLRLRILTCSGCGCTFAVAKAMFQHRRDTGRRLFCPGCGKANALQGSQDAGRQFAKITVPLAAAKRRPPLFSTLPAFPSPWGHGRPSDRLGGRSEPSDAGASLAGALTFNRPFLAIRRAVNE
ncbi:MAG: hypothetical protein ACM359_00400 [Bacillota bacterium]